jgi:hypothetical protein
MSDRPSPVGLKDALSDLKNRTLGKLSGDFARLVYLASTRNYNTGRYEHDGLAHSFSFSAAETALAVAHQEVFLALALTSLEGLFAELERYIRFECARPQELLATWEDLEAYRILVPTHVDPLTARIFVSNVRAALAIAQETCWGDPRGPRAAELPR